MDDLSENIIKGYELRELIGVGGFGAVYRAFQSVVGREVAIKVILPSYANHPDFVRRFETEAQIVARLEHIHIVPLYDFWRSPDGAYLVMRYYRRGSLGSMLKEGLRFDLEDVNKWAGQIGSALAVAHRHGIVHRDMKPDNILLDDENNAHLTDFGIAKTDETGEEEGIAGTPSYISPEQLKSEPVTPLSDIYSFGMMLYELLTGKVPFEDTSLSGLIAKHLNETIPDLTQIREDIPYELNYVIQRATAKDPEDRYPDALALANELREVALGGAVPLISVFDLEDVTNPYKGLRPFEEADSADFFGRDALIQQLANRIDEDDALAGFLAVVGPSGSGKSSVVKAGLVPALRHGLILGSEDWFIAEMIPGTEPLENLEAALLSVAFDEPDDLLKQLQEDERGLIRAVEAIFPGQDAALLLVIDQFEEVFTFAQTEAETLHFLQLLNATVRDPNSRIRVIATLRADFYDRPLLYPEFGALMRSRTEVVLPLNAHELEQAITGPAARVGIGVDANLVATIISDVSEEPGVLPLLQYVLTETFERCEGQTLTLEAYQSIGGVIGALARRAEELYMEMDATSQSVVRQIFLRLVTLGEGTEDTRRRVSWSELMSFADHGKGVRARETMQSVLDTFGKHRLLTTDRDPTTREPTVEVAHEALIREWTRLRSWLDESRADVRSQRILAGAAAEWIKAHRETSFLLAGARLTQYEEWSQTTDLALTQDERDYLEASLAQRDIHLKEEAARKAREEALERRVRQWLGVLVVVMTIAAIVAVFLMTEAQDARDVAEVNLNLAQTQSAIVARKEQETLSLAQAERALGIFPSNPQLAMAVALRANEISVPPTRSRSILTNIAYAPGMQRQFSFGTSQIADVAIGPDNQTALSASLVDAHLTLWDLETGAVIRELNSHTLPVTTIAFSPDGKTALSGSLDRRIILWHLEAGEPILELEGHSGIVDAVAFSADGKLALSGAEDDTMILWNLETGQLIHTFERDGDGVKDVAFHPDGNMALSAWGDNTIVLWDLEAKTAVHTLRQHTGDVLSAAFSPDGRHILSASRDELLILWDVTSGNVVRIMGEGNPGSLHDLQVNSLAFYPDGSRVITASDDGTLIIWDPETGTALSQLHGHTDKVTSVAVGRGGKLAISGSADHTIIVWDIGNNEIMQTFDPEADTELPVNTVALSRDGTIAFSGFEDGHIAVWDVDTGQEIRRLGHEDAGHSAPVTGFAVSSGGDTLLSGSEDTTVILWDISSGAPLRVFDGEEGHTDAVMAVAVSPDGSTAVTGSADNTLILWDIAGGTPLRTLEGHTRSVLSVAFSPDGNLVVSGSADSTLILWDVDTGNPIRTFEGHSRRVLSVAFSPDGQSVLSGAFDETLILWDLDTGEQIRQFTGHEGAVQAVAIFSDGHRAISGGDDHSLMVWNLDTGEVIRRLTGHTQKVISIALDINGRVALSGSTDGTSILWQTLPLNELIAWTQVNRSVPTITCEDHIVYQIPGSCDQEVTTDTAN